MSLALCIPADFCQQMEKAPISGNSVKIQQAPSPASGTSPTDDILAAFTPVPSSSDEIQTQDRIQRTALSGTRRPDLAVTPRQDKVEQIPFEIKIGTASTEEGIPDVSYPKKLFVRAADQSSWNFSS